MAIIKRSDGSDRTTEQRDRQERDEEVRRAVLEYLARGAQRAAGNRARRATGLLSEVVGGNGAVAVTDTCRPRFRTFSLYASMHKKRTRKRTPQ